MRDLNEYEKILADALGKMLFLKCSEWTDEEKEDGGMVRDHLSDHLPRRFLEPIDQDIWYAAWCRFDKLMKAKE